VDASADQKFIRASSRATRGWLVRVLTRPKLAFLMSMPPNPTVSNVEDLEAQPDLDPTAALGIAGR